MRNPRRLKESDILGVTWGSTVYHMINYLNPSQKVNAKFVTLHGSIACCENELDVRTLVSRMAKAFFGENYYLLTDALMSSKEASRIMKEEKKNPFLHLRILCPQRIWRC
ncbi:sugar-binding domain-containing protein [Blautia wexlerae]|uniref:sugar-binding domain-containing protein n=1 Tax=Blautia wexlerae TaxID=418240 RepID=UPI001899D4AC